MFCPKCHTELGDKALFCKRCGEKINSKRKSSWSSFSSSKTFERMNVKKTIEDDTKTILEKKEPPVSIEDHNETHDNQFNYSKNYSNVTKIDNELHQDQYTYSQNYSSINKQKVTSDEDYIKAYIGKTDSKWFNQQFSIPEAILGPFYYLYRKQFPQAIILIILYIASYRYMGDNSLFIRFGINIILAFIFNKNYLKEVNRRVNIIKKQNQNATSDELLEKCKRQGGTLTAVQVLAAMAIYFITIIVITTIKSPEIEQVHVEKIDNGIITYTIPEGMITKTYYNNYQHFIKTTDNGSCTLTVTNDYTTKEEDIFVKEQVNEYFSEYKQSNIEEMEINQLKWKYIILTKDNITRNIYVLKDKNTIYEISFSEENDACANDRNIILNSIQRK